MSILFDCRSFWVETSIGNRDAEHGYLSNAVGDF